MWEDHIHTKYAQNRSRNNNLRTFNEILGSSSLIDSRNKNLYNKFVSNVLNTTNKNSSKESKQLLIKWQIIMEGDLET